MQNDALQIIITILSIVTTIVTLVKQIPRRDTPVQPGSTVISPPAPARRLDVDLSFVLLCATFLSLLLTDSLIISGREASLGFRTTLAVFSITAVIVAVMYAGWYFRRTEMVTGLLAVMTLTVLIISPGGPFSPPTPGAKDVQTGLTPYLPVLSLITLAATMLIYSFGSPLSPAEPRGRRYLVSATLIVLALVGAYALGHHLERQVMLDRRTPRITNAPEARSEIAKLDLQQRKLFYQLAMEAELARWYQESYQELRKLQPQVPPDDGSGAAPPPARSQSSSDSVRLFGSAGNERLMVLLDQFRKMPIEDKEKLLLDRLDWVHPVGRRDERITLPLTGLSAQDRLTKITLWRLFQILISRASLRAQLFAEFPKDAYPPEISSRFTATENEERKISTVIANLFPKKEESEYHLAAFPVFSPTERDYRLEMQLAMPATIEGSLAFNEYSQLALDLVKNRNSNPQDDAIYQGIVGRFGKLPDGSQRALRHYMAKDGHPLEVIRDLAKLSAISFTSLADASTSAAFTLRSYLHSYVGAAGPDTSDSAEPLDKLAREIVTKGGIDVAKTVERILGREDPDVPVKHLFDKGVFDFIAEVDKLTNTSKQDFFAAVADPVWAVTQSLAHRVSALQRSDPTDRPSETLFDPALAAFGVLAPPDQEGVLNQVALGIYQRGDDSLGPFSLLVFEAKVQADWLGLLCAAILMLPLVLGCLLAADYASRKLVARDAMRDLVARELGSLSESAPGVGMPVDVLYGRSEILQKLQALAERGWSTIGVVGRRGVGKSRILYALSQLKQGEDLRAIVKVWVASPSRFQEDDFIASIFERLAISTEQSIASFLGARPLSVRLLDRRSSERSTWCYAGALALLVITMYQMYDRLTRPDIVVAWLPIATLLLGSLCLATYYRSKVQPVDLSKWLQRDRSHNPHTLMLYREVCAALKFLQERPQQLRADERERQQAASSLRGFVLKICFVILVFALWAIASSFTSWAVVASAGAVIIYLYRKRDAPDEGVGTRGQSMMSLIAEYRSFASTIVYRLKEGGLGASEGRKLLVLVCIDELDKIVDFEEIRAFVRRIKAIFEVPGVYYYVSLAEDTLTALYLGAATGKNEIDSSFDHVVRIPPLSCDDGEAIARQYLQTHGVDTLHPRLARLLAAISYGIPRDIIRRCDEYIAGLNGPSGRVDELLTELRKVQATLGYELADLSSSQVAELCEGPLVAARTAQRLLLEFEEGSEPRRRLVMSLWLLALAEVSFNSPNEQEWRKQSHDLSIIGYRVPAERVKDLFSEVTKLHTALIGISPGSAPPSNSLVKR